MNKSHIYYGDNSCIDLLMDLEILAISRMIRWETKPFSYFSRKLSEQSLCKIAKYTTWNFRGQGLNP